MLLTVVSTVVQAALHVGGVQLEELVHVLGDVVVDVLARGFRPGLNVQHPVHVDAPRHSCGFGADGDSHTGQAGLVV